MQYVIETLNQVNPVELGIYIVAYFRVSTRLSRIEGRLEK
jgi:hypothetical protein